MKKHDCINCSHPIEKKSYESSNRYLSRKFCSQECSKVYMKINKIGWFSDSKSKKTTLENLDNIDSKWKY